MTQFAFFHIRVNRKGGSHIIAKQTSTSKTPLPANQQASPLYASSIHASAHRTARFHPANFRLRCSSGTSA